MAERNDSPVEGELFYICFPCVRVRRLGTKIEFVYVSSEESTFTCRRCQRSCKFVLQAVKVPPHHRLSHLCSECNQRFSTPSDLFNHSYGHSGDWPFRCRLCYEGFAMNSEFERHVARRETVRNLRCNECCREFKAKICPRTYTDMRRLQHLYCRNCCNVENRDIIEYVSP
ncbi:hypothetical protein TNIN_135001 [Trichonephila inaurata madagascariensis]|uniref:C2H2-type domain-containing protein n=1 Tax=Trichonephila inaurata madagascariensis TaxID=2747483 RepID=A0A8X6Y003_9ARAC|nr:hypothetical protein TNIN_135001 [Trichonephila inaurata madagascariensis]